MSYRVFVDGDKEQADEGLFKHVLEAMRLVEKDTLGGAGSRGCGQVKFSIRVNGEERTLDQVTEKDFPTVSN